MSVKTATKLDISNPKLKELLKKFKPEFGNTQHINIVEKIGMISKENQKLRQKKTYEKMGRGQGTVVKRIDYLERCLINELESIVDKSVN